MKCNKAETTPASNQIITCLNHAGASPSPEVVIQRITEHLRLEQQVGGYPAAAMVHDELERVYQRIADVIDCSSTEEIAIVESATVAWTRLFYAFGDFLLQQYQYVDSQMRNSSSFSNMEASATTTGGDNRRCRRHRRVILVSQAEYAANLVAACQWAKKHSTADWQWTVQMIPSRENSGKVSLEAFQSVLSSIDHDEIYTTTIAMVCVTHVPTNSGIVNPVEEIGYILQQYNQQHRSEIIPAYLTRDKKSIQPDHLMLPSILYLVDACQSIGQLPVSTKRLHCHGLVATGRKWLRGPRGSGWLFCRQDLLMNDQGDSHNNNDTSNRKITGLWPSQMDHFGVPIRQVKNLLECIQNGESIDQMLDMAPRSGAKRFEFWESSIAIRLGLGKALEIALDLGIAEIRSRICKLSQYLYQHLLSVHEVCVLYPPECGIVSFWILHERIRAESLHEHLSMHKFDVSVSPYTSTPLDSCMTSAQNVIRVSASYTNTTEDLDRFLNVLRILLSAPSLQV